VLPCLSGSEALMNERDIQAELVNEKKTDIIYIQKYEYMMKEMQKNHIWREKEIEMETETWPGRDQ